MAVILAVLAVGNYLAFAYFNAQAPLRFLMQVIGPATATAAIALGHAWGWRTDAIQAGP